MTQQQIKGQAGDLGSDGSLDVYTVPGSVIVTPYSVSATFDGSGASGFIPCLTFKTQTGAVIARCPAPEVASGDTAEVSWFPHVAQAAAASSGGIQYDVDNTGDWLSVEASSAGGTYGYAIAFAVDNDGGMYLIDNGNGGFYLTDNGTGGLQLAATRIINLFSSGSIKLATDGSGEEILLESDGGISFQDTADPGDGGISFDESPGNFITMNLPTSSPGVVGALWNNGGVVNIDP